MVLISLILRLCEHSKGMIKGPIHGLNSEGFRKTQKTISIFIHCIKVNVTFVDVHVHKTVDHLEYSSCFLSIFLFTIPVSSALACFPLRKLYSVHKDLDLLNRVRLWQRQSERVHQVVV